MRGPNSEKFFSRFINAEIGENKSEKKNNTYDLLNSNRNSDLAEALMEFGATVCKPKNPLCYNCNLKKKLQVFQK